MTWLEEISQAIENLGGVAEYQAIYDYIEKHTFRTLSPHWKGSVRAIIEDHSSDAQFRSGKDIFYSANGIGRGVWGLRSKIQPSIPAIDISEPESPLPPKIQLEISRIIRDTYLARQLKQLHNNMCQICGQTIDMGNKKYSEAHHIQPLGSDHNGPDVSQNIIILCPNHHVEFDYGVIGIDPRTLRVVHRNNSNEFHNSAVLVVRNHSLGEKFLQYHLDYIFIR